MTKKDFQAVAKMIKDVKGEYNEEEAQKAINRIADRIADIFGNDNPRFDKGRFIEACGIDK